MRRAKIVALPLLFVLITVGQVSHASSYAPEPLEDDSLIATIDQYSNDFNVDEVTARAALAFQNETEVLLDELAAKYPTIYTDAEFTNGESYSLTVFVKEGADPTLIKEAISRTEKSSDTASGRIEVDLAPYSRSELEAFALEWAKLVDVPEKDGTMSVLDAQRGLMTVHIPRTDLARADEVAQLIETQVVEFPLPVEITFTDEWATLAACTPPVIGWLEGGRRMYMRWSEDECGSGAICTSGFSATRAGYQGVVTAAHCPGSASDDLASVLWANNTTEMTSTRFK